MKPIKKTEDDYTCAVKIIMIGDSGVGKTNILLKYTDNQFNQTHMSTVGVDFKVKLIKLQTNTIKFQIWDTAGQQRFANINQTFYKGAIGIILCYSIVDLNSFNNVQNWMKQIHQFSPAKVKVILVANKCDLQQRKVSPEAGQNLAKKYGMDFLQVSAKHGTNIQEIFMIMARDINTYLLQQENQINKQRQNNIRKSLNNNPPPQKSNKSCSC